MIVEKECSSIKLKSVLLNRTKLLENIVHVFKLKPKTAFLQDKSTKKCGARLLEHCSQAFVFVLLVLLKTCFSIISQVRYRTEKDQFLSSLRTRVCPELNRLETEFHHDCQKRKNKLGKQVKVNLI